MSRPVLKECFEVPIYDAKVWLIVTDSITRERKKWEREFGPWNETSEYNGLCSYNGRRVGIFIDREHTDEIGLIAHEVFHATHRILDWVGVEFSVNNHEPFAYMNEYLMRLIVPKLAKIRRQRRSD